MSGASDLDAVALRAAVVARTTTVADVVSDTFARIDAVDSDLGVFLNTERAWAEERAAKLDRRLAAGETPGPLFGVPVALKANMCLAGFESNCASKILRGYRAPYTATFVQRLLDAGAIPVGMTNMDEFAMGSSSENSAFGPTRNPWDRERTPGGSSSGSAVAVAAGLVPIALGSDTGGSVRQPAALCGIFGFKPTYGRVSRFGLIAFGSSLDQVSPFARSVRDIELVLSVISGADENDATCLAEPAFEPERSDSSSEAQRGHTSAQRGGSFFEGQRRGSSAAEKARNVARLDGLRVGVPKEYFPGVLEPGVRRVCEDALAVLAAAGAELVPIELPHTDYAIPTYYVVATAEASSNLARYDGVRYGLRVAGSGSLQSMFAATREAGFGPEVKRRILLGTYVLSAGYYDAWYGRALKVRSLLRRDFEAAFEKVDVIAGPTSPTTAFKLGERVDDPVAMYLSDVLTVPTSLVGLPAISVPCGFAPVESRPAESEALGRDPCGLPVGLQIIGPYRGDARVLRVARAFESATEHAAARPPLAATSASNGASGSRGARR